MITDKMLFQAHAENIMRELGIFAKIKVGNSPVLGKNNPGCFIYKANKNTVYIRNYSMIWVLAHELMHVKQREERRLIPPKLKTFSEKRMFGALNNYEYLTNKNEEEANAYALSYCSRNRLYRDSADVSFYIYENKSAKRLYWGMGIAAVSSILYYLLT